MQPFDLTSAGKASAELQHPVARILQVADRMGITPSRINGVPHFSADDLTLIASTIRATSTDATGLASRGAGLR